jgi:hypothetical protein
LSIYSSGVDSKQRVGGAKAEIEDSTRVATVMWSWRSVCVEIEYIGSQRGDEGRIMKSSCAGLFASLRARVVAAPTHTTRRTKDREPKLLPSTRRFEHSRTD